MRNSPGNVEAAEPGCQRARTALSPVAAPGPRRSRSQRTTPCKPRGQHRPPLARAAQRRLRTPPALGGAASHASRSVAPGHQVGGHAGASAVQALVWALECASAHLGGPPTSYAHLGGPPTAHCAGPAGRGEITMPGIGKSAQDLYGFSARGGNDSAPRRHARARTLPTHPEATAGNEEMRGGG